VVATDASEKQIANASPHKHVDYRVAPAENSGIDSGIVDLIMVAQALHWFDLPRFYKEARRVLKNKGLLAASAYKFLHITPEIDELINSRYYDQVVGPFWPPERVLIEKFEAMAFPFPELKSPLFQMVAHWKIDHVLGYLQSWSATQRFITANNRSPLDEIADELRAAWGDRDESKQVTWPLTLRVGIKANPEPLIT